MRMDTRILSNGLSKNIRCDLISSCERMSIDSGETMFIFDIADSFEYFESDEDRRDRKISSIIDDGFYVGNVIEFANCVSRWSYYDTITKTSNQSLRYHKVYKFITEDLGLFDRKSILDPTREVIFTRGSIRLILKPNLFIEIAYLYDQDNRESCGFRFFDPDWILKSINEIPEDVKRDAKIDIILRNG